MAVLGCRSLVLVIIIIIIIICMVFRYNICSAWFLDIRIYQIVPSCFALMYLLLRINCNSFCKCTLF